MPSKDEGMILPTGYLRAVEDLALRADKAERELNEWLITVGNLENDRIEWRERTRKAEQQRDELLMVMELLMDQIEDSIVPDGASQNAARTAIAKVKGEK